MTGGGGKGEISELGVADKDGNPAKELNSADMEMYQA